MVSGLPGRRAVRWLWRQGSPGPVLNGPSPPGRASLATAGCGAPGRSRLAVLYDAGGRLADAPHVFTGDSLFPGGVGKTNSPADFTSLLNDVTERLFGQLPDPTWVYPGHGNDTTLGVRAPAPGRVARRAAGKRGRGGRLAPPEGRTHGDLAA